MAVNIWSHLIGAAQFLFSLLQFLNLQDLARQDSIHRQDVLVAGVYYICVVVCFALSTIFHIFSDHGPDIHRFGNELDHLGIVLVMWGTGVTGLYFTFYCQPMLQFVYFVALCVAGLGCDIFTMQPKFRQPTYRTVRFLTYCFLGFSIFVPFFHGLYIFGLPILNHRMGVWSFLGLAAINFSGAAIYAARIPERWFSGTFDILGQSHNLMHILVICGALVRLNGLLAVLEQWQQSNMQYGFCYNG